MTKPKLLASFADGEGSVQFPADWESLDWVLRADLLRDWISDLTEKYNVTLMEEGRHGHA